MSLAFRHRVCRSHAMKAMEALEGSSRTAFNKTSVSWTDSSRTSFGSASTSKASPRSKLSSSKLSRSKPFSRSLLSKIISSPWLSRQWLSSRTLPSRLYTRATIPMLAAAIWAKDLSRLITNRGGMRSLRLLGSIHSHEGRTAGPRNIVLRLPGLHMQRKDQA